MSAKREMQKVINYKKSNADGAALGSTGVPWPACVGIQRGNVGSERQSGEQDPLEQLSWGSPSLMLGF